MMSLTGKTGISGYGSIKELVQAMEGPGTQTPRNADTIKPFDQMSPEEIGEAVGKSRGVTLTRRK